MTNENDKIISKTFSGIIAKETNKKAEGTREVNHLPFKTVPRVRNAARIWTSRQQAAWYQKR